MKIRHREYAKKAMNFNRGLLKCILYIKKIYNVYNIYKKIFNNKNVNNL